jgi:putative ABC transport system substrate-binding protein
LFDPNFWTANLTLSAVQAAAGSLNRRLQVLPINNDAELDAALTTMSRTHFDAAIISAGPFFYNRQAKIVEMIARSEIPTMFEAKESVESGGLIAYGSSVPDAYRWVGIYAGRILKGEKPADLPVVQPTKLDLAINLKTAKALGITVPPSLLARADEVIE